MSDYSQITFFEPKDSLPTTDPAKVVRGSEIDPEFAAISTAIATKYDSSDLATGAEATDGTANDVLMTPLRTSEAIADTSPVTVGVQTGLSWGTVSNDGNTNGGGSGDWSVVNVQTGVWDVTFTTPASAQLFQSFTASPVVFSVQAHTLTVFISNTTQVRLEIFDQNGTPSAAAAFSFQRMASLA